MATDEESVQKHPIHCLYAIESGWNLPLFELNYCILLEHSNAYAYVITHTHVCTYKYMCVGGCVCV